MSDKTTYVYNYDEPRIQRLEAALEQNTKVLSDMSKELAAERKMTDTLAQALEEVKDWAEWEQDKFPWYKAVDAALSDWRTARGAK